MTKKQSWAALKKAHPKQTPITETSVPFRNVVHDLHRRISPFNFSHEGV